MEQQLSLYETSPREALRRVVERINEACWDGSDETFAALGITDALESELALEALR